MQSSPTSSARESLREFRATHTVLTSEVGGHVWDVVSSGQGEPPLVLLPGGGGSAESQFRLIDRFEKHRRVLSIGCPATITNVGDVVEGLAQLLDQCEVADCVLLGHSLGGVFAQAFAGAYPARVRGLIFANTGTYSRWHGLFVATALRSARYVPKRLVASFLSARVRRLLGNHRDREFWVEYFSRDEFERVGVAGAANRGRCIADSIAWATGRPYAGPVLIIESDNETGFSPAERSAFKRSYPQASLRTFPGAGHLSSITRCDEFVAEVSAFMERSQSPAPR